ncbi:hypothetical protein AUG19_08960 [archaeon 13_1_20CM_2_54_9]|nr:MAG: hypothetical protein AUJ07_01915 [Crenarchaeota archaeon 13_1_40CM_3_53_5]OLE74356.1 MAG: hypothetical protein AUG19_08960 [archaeon 13_1_20CM_2_54_9]
MKGKGPQRKGEAGFPSPMVFLVFLLIGLVVNLFYPLPFSSTESVTLLLLGFGIMDTCDYTGCWRGSKGCSRRGTSYSGTICRSTGKAFTGGRGDPLPRSPPCRPTRVSEVQEIVSGSPE